MQTYQEYKKMADAAREFESTIKVGEEVIIIHAREEMRYIEGDLVGKTGVFIGRSPYEVALVDGSGDVEAYLNFGDYLDEVRKGTSDRPHYTRVIEAGNPPDPRHYDNQEEFDEACSRWMAEHDGELRSFSTNEAPSILLDDGRYVDVRDVYFKLLEPGDSVDAMRRLHSEYGFTFDYDPDFANRYRTEVMTNELVDSLIMGGGFPEDLMSGLSG